MPRAPRRSCFCERPLVSPLQTRAVHTGAEFVFLMRDPGGVRFGCVQFGVFGMSVYVAGLGFTGEEWRWGIAGPKQLAALVERGGDGEEPSLSHPWKCTRGQKQDRIDKTLIPRLGRLIVQGAAPSTAPNCSYHVATKRGYSNNVLVHSCDRVTCEGPGLLSFGVTLPCGGPAPDLYQRGNSVFERPESDSSVLPKPKAWVRSCFRFV